MVMSIMITSTTRYLHIDHLRPEILPVFPRDFALRVLLWLVPVRDGCLISMMTRLQKCRIILMEMIIDGLKSKVLRRGDITNSWWSN